MDSYGRRQIVDSTDKEKAACSGSRLGLSVDQITENLLIQNSLEQPKVSFAGELRYLTQLWVSRNEEPREELHVSDSFQSKISQKTREKISAALKLLAFRDPHAIIQFWRPCSVGKHQLMTTVDQPFGLTSPVEELFFYRKDSVRNLFLVDKNHPEDDISPPARVFRRGLPEWSSDLTNYPPKGFAQQDCAVRCNLHGYLALPVFDSTTQLCVGVLELLMSSKNTSYAFEVQQIHKELKTQNLTSPQVFGSAAPKVPNQCKRDEDKIFGMLKTICEIHKVPFAQTWAESASTSFNAHDKMIEKSCCSFNTSCIGKVCMFSHSLPYCVQDPQMWSLREASIELHLDKSRSFVGRALFERGSIFCEDITQLSKEEYPLAHYAHTGGLMSCFAIWLHGIEGDNNYVLEFLLPFDIKDSKQVLNLVQTLRKNTLPSEFEVGEISPKEFAVSPRHSSGSVSGSNSDSESDSESDLGSFLRTDSADVPGQCSSKERSPFDKSGNINMVGLKENSNATSYFVTINQKTGDTITDAEEKSKPLERDRKRKIDSVTLLAFERHVGKPISQAAESFGVSRSTSKRYCPENGMPSSPKPNQSEKTNHATDPKLKQKVIVKATFANDMIKFWFPPTSGLLELKTELAQKFALKGKLINIKYRDEENDLLLITCDDDLHHLPEFLASNTNTTVKLFVELVAE